MSCRWRHKVTSVWEPQSVLRVACHSTWGCGGVRKEDFGQPWRLTKYDQVSSSENERISDAFMGYKNETLGWNGLIPLPMQFFDES